MTKTKSKNSKLNPQIEKMLDLYVSSLTENKKFTPISVDEITSRVAKFYESVRKIVDWKDDNALRRAAIERVLKRLLFTKVSGISVKKINADELAERVTVELIRGGHLPNDTIPVERLAPVSKALEKYSYFLDFASKYNALEVKKRVNFTTFVIEIAACEIEEILTNPVKEYALIQSMTETLSERIKIIPKDKITSEQKHKYIFVATCRALFELDDNFITYHILGGSYKNWSNPTPDEIAQMAQALFADWKKIEIEINSREVGKFVDTAENIDTIFLLINDVLDSYKEKPKKIIKLFKNKNSLTNAITTAYNKRYKTLKRRLFRLAVFSTLSVFLSNWFTFFIVEVPLAQLFYEKFNLFAAIADFLIPTFLMFFLVVIIRPPGKRNIDKVRSTMLGVIYADEKQEQYQIKIQKRNFSVTKAFMYTVYIYSMLAVFAAIAYLFYIAQLPMTSIVFDTFTIALTVYAAVVIKTKANELSVDRHTSLVDFMMDLVSVPIAKVGSIFASKWKEYNLAAILFNFLVETPFVAILDFLQDWSEFMKERKAELR